MSHRPSRAGFTLSEVLVALAVLMVGAAVIASVTFTATELYQKRRHFAQAILVAEAKMEGLLVMDPESADIAVGEHGPEYFDPSGEPERRDGLFEATWSVSEHPVGMSMVDLRVVVTWTEEGHRQFVTLDTVREGAP